jgi:hypothetical protein
MNLATLSNKIGSLNVQHYLALKKVIKESQSISTFDLRPYLIAILNRQEKEIQTMVQQVGQTHNFTDIRSHEDLV